VNPIISLTTIPDRIERIETCIKSLSKQGFQVYLWAVEKIERSETVLGELPEFLEKYGVNVQIVPDCGPITKLLPALKMGAETILTADDDCVYGRGWAQKLLTWSRKHPGAALGYRGRILTGNGYLGSRLVLKSKIKKPTKVDIITGVHGALYKAEMFDDAIFEEWKRWPSNDDLVIAAHLKRKRIPPLVVPGPVLVRDNSVRRIEPLIRINTGNGHELNDRGLRVLGLEKRKRHKRRKK